MATNIGNVKNIINRYLGDSSQLAVTDTDRYDAMKESMQKLYTDFGVDFMTRTLSFDYFDTLNWYDITSSAPHFLEPISVYRIKGERDKQFTRRTSGEIKIDIDNGDNLPSYSIDIANQKTYLVVNHNSKYSRTILSACNSLTDNGTWAIDTTNSDATNLSLDTTEYKYGSGAIMFDISVAQSANNFATLTLTGMPEVDATDDYNLSSMIIWVYIPDATYITSVTMYWGSSNVDYWVDVANTDAFGQTFADGWNRVKVNWADATVVGTPDKTAISYLRFDINYTASQGDISGVRIDEIALVRPEKLTFEYQSTYIGKDATGSFIDTFTADTDIPLYSGVYDGFDVYVGMKSASSLFLGMGSRQEGIDYNTLADGERKKIKNRFPTTTTHPVKSFRPNISWKK